MNLTDIWANKEFHYHKPSSLIVMLVASAAFISAIVLSLLHIYVKNPILDASIFVIIMSLLGIHWSWYRTSFPKGKKNHEYIIIAIVTENLPQKTRIQKDLTYHIEEALIKYSLSNTYRLKVLHNHLAESIYEKIRNIRRSGGYRGLEGDRFSIIVDRILARMNARLLVYGKLVERDLPDSAYYIDIEAFLTHAPVNLRVSNVALTRIKEIWENHIRVLKSEEHNGFKSEAQNLTIAATYMIALAAFLGSEFEKCISICNAVIGQSRSNSELEKYTKRTEKLKGECYQLLALIAHHEGDRKKFTEYRRQKQKYLPDKYERLLEQSIELVLNGEFVRALGKTNQASVESNGDGTWRYNKLYILISLRKHTLALQVLDRILEVEFKSESSIIDQVISFNDNQYRSNSDHIQTDFMNGIIQFKKLNNAPLAYEKFGKFISSAKASTEDWQPLIQRTNLYLKELEETIGID